MTATRRLVAGAALAAAMLAPLGPAPVSAQTPAEAGEAAAPEPRLEEIGVGELKQIPPLTIGRASTAASSLEEVTVRGQRSMLSYRIEIEAARDRIYDVFNALNSSDEFDVTCDYERPTGTRIPQRRCRPEFLKQATAEAGRAFLDAMLFEGNAQAGMSRAMAANSRAQVKHRLLVEEMSRLVTEHPALAEAFIEYFRLQDEYREARERRND